MYLKLDKNCNEFTLMGGGGQISTTLDNVTERGVACEFFSNQSDKEIVFNFLISIG